MSLKMNTIPGQMPFVWDRQIVFFANILSLFFGNETETDVLRQEVGAIETYGARLVPIIDLMFPKSTNLLILEHKPDKDLLNYFNELGLTLPETRVLSHRIYTDIPDPNSPYKKQIDHFLTILRESPALWVDGFVTDETLAKVAELTGKQTISSLSGSLRGNNKYLLQKYLEQTGLPYFDTCYAKGKKDVRGCLKSLKDKGYSWAVVKAQIGASGIGMQKVSLNGALQKVSVDDYLFHEGPCLVQGWLDDSVSGIEYVGSPSVQLFVKEDMCSLYDITDQILSKDSIHEGNIAPPSYLTDSIQKELLEQAQEVGRWLHDQGYRGTASVDFLLINRNKKIEVRVCELNARVTGATYPALLARNFTPKGAWLMRNIRFDPPLSGGDILELLTAENFLFRKKEKQGVLPFNFNPNPGGQIVKGQFVFLGPTTHDVQRLMKKMSEMPSLKGVYDRD